ncbi:DUF1232 domain-containing protein [Avibacterium sp. 21-586]|uniref:YkvA family protein n=1 Tax=Avibacterium sp. 21-586 TaxID=2911534 RepID=UPI0022450880|nr:YkvA family protein [Avibacterium sp. 21-586]MCW9709350.1 DUF1232 domain-containing protein [Avibacterium sp. 21-586]
MSLKSEHKEKHIQDYEENLSDTRFWKKLKNNTQRVGKKAIEYALKMYYSARDPETPTWAKGVVYSALGYFVFPIDTIPDFIPLIGYTDDVSVIAIALATIARHIKDRHSEQAKNKVNAWFKS